jgi:hypothetical protein
MERVYRFKVALKLRRGLWRRIEVKGAHATKRYLEKRGLSRPDIPWNKVKSWYKDAKKTK